MTVYAPTYCPGTECDPCMCQWQPAETDINNPDHFVWTQGKLCRPYFAAQFWEDRTSTSGEIHGMFLPVWPVPNPTIPAGFNYAIFSNTSLNNQIFQVTGRFVPYTDPGIRPKQYDEQTGTSGGQLVRYYSEYNNAPKSFINNSPAGLPMLGFIYQGVLPPLGTVTLVGRVFAPFASRDFTQYGFFHSNAGLSSKPRIRVPLVGRTL